MSARCAPFVSLTAEIDHTRWESVSRGMHLLGYGTTSEQVPSGVAILAPDAKKEGKGSDGAGLDLLEAKLPDGLGLARRVRAEARERAAVLASNWRPPCLAIVTVGDPEAFAGGDERVSAFSSTEDSWFKKRHVLRECGVRIQEVALSKTADYAEVAAAIARCNSDTQVRQQ